MLGFTFVGSFSAEVHKFQYKSCFVPCHFYSKSGKNTGTLGKFNTGDFHLKLCEITTKMLLLNFNSDSNLYCFISFDNKRLNFNIMEKMTWGFTYFDQLIIEEGH